jgi:hypothetical protein
MILAGLGLGGSVAVAWPEAPSAARAHAVDLAASAGTSPKRSLANAPDTIYPGSIFVYELRSSMLIDSIMATPQRVDAH